MRSILRALAGAALALALPAAAHAGLPAARSTLEQERAALLADPAAKAPKGALSAAQRLARLDQALAQPDWPTTGRAIAVNVAKGEVLGLEDGVVVFASKAIVGKPSSRTPRFTANATSVTLNPSWTTPPGISAAEYGGRKVTVPPGPKNPLGHVRVDLPNGHAVFLHSTNQPHLFQRTDRHTFSHGCVRVQDALGLARWLMGEDKWAAADADAVVKGWRTKAVRLDAPVPVLIEYRLASVGADGRVAYHDDPYGLLGRAK